MGIIERPGADDHAPYYGRYIEQVGDGDIVEALEAQRAETLALLGATPPDLERHRYAPEKWSVREVVAHLIDTERVFAYRALSFARGDAGPLPGMEQNQWNEEARGDEVPLARLAEELDAVRRSSIALFARMTPEALERRGVASGVSFTVRAFPWIIAGHELHHRGILLERYGLAGIG